MCSIVTGGNGSLFGFCLPSMSTNSIMGSVMRGSKVLLIKMQDTAVLQISDGNVTVDRGRSCGVGPVGYCALSRPQVEIV